MLLQVADEIRSPVAEADNRDPDRGVVARNAGEADWHQAVPLFRTSCIGVWHSNLRSRPSDQPRAYATSMSRASANVAFARAVTCQRPVTPAGTMNRS